MPNGPELDHLLWAAPDLDAAVDDLERRLGVRAAPGGKHPAWGTRNALIALGGLRYLEVIGPDPDARRTTRRRPLGLDSISEPRLATWVARSHALERVVEAAAGLGLDLGVIRTGSRHRSDGVLLRWSMTDLFAKRLGGVVPFFIDWGSTAIPRGTHPRDASWSACTRSIPMRSMSPPCWTGSASRSRCAMVQDPR